MKTLVVVEVLPCVSCLLACCANKLCAGFGENEETEQRDTAPTSKAVETRLREFIFSYAVVVVDSSTNG